MQIDPVEHGAGDLALIIGGTPRRSATGQRSVAQMAAATWVHSRDELDVGGKGHVRIGARNIDPACLERLSQRIEHGTLEFRKFIEEQDAEMREADLAWLDPQPSASERCHARRMVRRAKRTGAADTPFFQRSGHGLHHADLQCFRRRKRRENAGKAAGQKALARAGRPDHQQVRYTYTQRYESCGYEDQSGGNDRSWAVSGQSAFGAGHTESRQHFRAQSILRDNRAMPH